MLSRAAGCPESGPGTDVGFEDDGGHRRRDQGDPEDARPGHHAPAAQRRHRNAQNGVEEGEQGARHRHLPQHRGVVSEVVEGAVADQHLAHVEHHLGQEGEGEDAGEDGSHLGQDVVDAGQGPGEDEGQHPLAAVGADEVGGDQGDEEQKGAAHPDVLPVGDEREVLGGRIAGEVADADVDHRRHDGDGEQAEGSHLLPPRPAQADGPAQRGSVQGQHRRPPAAEGALVGPVAPVVDGAAGAHGAGSAGQRPGPGPGGRRPRRARSAGW